MAGGATGCCCCSCSNSDVVLLTDSTGSMGVYISVVKSIFNSFRERFESPTCRWLVADYKDHEDGGDYSLTTGNGVKIDQSFTTDFGLVQAAVNGLSASGGGDLPEENYAALKYLADNWVALGGRSDPSAIKRVIVWGGDAPSWNGSPATKQTYPTRPEVLTALLQANIKVFGLNVQNANAGLDGSSFADNLPNQARTICLGTGGQLFNNVNSNESILQALCEALK